MECVGVLKIRWVKSGSSMEFGKSKLGLDIVEGSMDGIYLDVISYVVDGNLELNSIVLCFQERFGMIVIVCKGCVSM